MKVAVQLNPSQRTGEWIVGVDIQGSDGGNVSWRVGEIIRTGPEFRVTDRITTDPEKAHLAFTSMEAAAGSLFMSAMSLATQLNANPAAAAA